MGRRQDHAGSSADDKTRQIVLMSGDTCKTIRCLLIHGS